MGGGATAYKRHAAGKKLEGLADYFRQAAKEKQEAAKAAPQAAQADLQELIRQAKKPRELGWRDFVPKPVIAI